MTAWNKSRAVLRPDVVTRAVALCTDTRRGVLVVGPPGSGASQCAADIAAGLRAAGVPVVLWDDLDRHPGPARAAGPGLDRHRRAGTSVVVASARLGAALDPDDDDEVRTRTTRLPLRNLTRAESEAAVSAAVDLPLSVRLVEALWTCSHGNLAALRATFDDLASRGLVRRTRDRMELTVDPATAVAEVAVDPRLWIDDADLGPLTTAALARRISLDDLVRLHGDAEVSDLIARGLLVARRDEGVGGTAGAERLIVQPPVLATALRAGADHRRRRDVYQAILARAGRQGRAAPEPHIVLWALEHSPAADPAPVDDALVVVAPDTVTVVGAARAALDSHDYRTGVALVDAARRTGLVLSPLQEAELALIAGSCLRLLDRLQESAAALERSLDLLREHAGRAGAVALGGPTGAGESGAGGPVDPGDPDFARLVVEAVTARADLAHYWDRHPENSLPMIDAARLLLPREHPAQTVLDALTVTHLTYSGRYREAARAYTELTASAPAVPLPADWGRRLEAMHALSLDSLGRSEEALAVLRRVARRARSMPSTTWASEEYLSALLSVVLHGFGVNALLAELAPFVAVEQDDSFRMDHGMRRVVDAEISLAAGDLPSALSAATDGVETVEVDGPEDFLPRALSLLALTAALSGQTSLAQEQLQRMRAIPGYTNSPVGPEIRAAEVGTLLCLRELSEARQLFQSMIDDGLSGAAIRAGMGAVLMGDPEICRGVAGLEVSGDALVLVRDLATAMLAESPRRLLDAAQRARGCGLLMVAAAAADRARTLAAPGSQHRMMAERMLATSEFSGPLAGLGKVGGAAGSVPPGVSLTRRESQIADLVGQGLTNSEIAAELHLSKRTVEGHLNRIYTKTGTRLRG